MQGSSVFTERGWTEVRNFYKRIGRYLIVSLMFGISSSIGFIWFYTLPHLRPLQQLYLGRYARALVLSKSPVRVNTTYVLLVRTVTDQRGKEVTLGITDDQADLVRGEDGKPIRIGQRGNAYMFRLKPGIEHKGFYWLETHIENKKMASWFATNVYQDVTLIGLIVPSVICGFVVFLLASITTLGLDFVANRKESEGKSVRGTLALVARDYLRKHKDAKGIGLFVHLIGGDGFPIFSKLRNLLGAEERKYWIRIPQEKETQHVLLLGDSGTGKSQVIHSFLRQIAGRRPAESVIIYDPACEFVKRHFCSNRGDLILNPLDIRSPYWSPSAEIEYSTDRALIAESFFPGRENSSLTAQFFVTASRSIFNRMLEFKPTPQQIIEWLQSGSQIDALVKGTEHAHYIDPNAGNQRGGVLGSLAEVGASLRLLPSPQDCSSKISLTDWARQRKGWLFITSTRDTRDALRPLQAVFLDILLKRLMSSDESFGDRNPCWVIADEVHSLKRLPALHDCLSEGRKHGIKIVLGTQGKSQFEEYYGNLSETMLSIPNLKILFRTNEPRAAKWIADLIGDNEREKQRISTNAAVNDNRDSIHYATFTEVRAVISKEEIMGLEDLSGYWKYKTEVVGFRYPYHLSKPIAHGFRPRETKTTKTIEAAIPLKTESPSASAIVKKTKKTKQARDFPEQTHPIPIADPTTDPKNPVIGEHQFDLFSKL